MRKSVLTFVLMAITLALLPILAEGSGCLYESTVIGNVRPQKAPLPKELPSDGPPYALYWFFHSWCSSCRAQADVIKSFHESYRAEVQIYGVPLSGTEGEVSRFLQRKGLSTIPILQEAADAFGSMSTHPVLVFRTKENSYYRINGYTSLPQLERIFKTFNRG